MKINWMIILSCIFACLLGGCAASSHHAPELQSFQGPSLPMESSQAAQVAHTM